MMKKNIEFDTHLSRRLDIIIFFYKYTHFTPNSVGCYNMPELDLS